MADELIWSMRIKRDSAANWTSVNPILLDGQFGWETDTNKLKIGTGANWNSTPYFGDGAPVTVGWGDIEGNLEDQLDLYNYLLQITESISNNANIITATTINPVVGSRQNIYRVKALATNLTVGPWSGSVSEGDRLIIAIKDDNVSRTISFATPYKFGNITPTLTTTPGVTILYEFVANVTDSTFECLTISQSSGDGNLTGTIPASGKPIPYGSGTANDLATDPMLFWFNNGPTYYIGAAYLRMGYFDNLGYFGIDGSEFGNFVLGNNMTHLRINRTVGSGQVGVSFDGNETFLIQEDAITYKNQYSNSATPSIAAGTGAGTGPTISIVGTNKGGYIQITTGTGSPIPAGDVATVTFSGSFAFPNGCSVSPSARDDNAGALSLSSIFRFVGTTTGFVIHNPNAALLAPNTTYTINYITEGF